MRSTFLRKRVLGATAVAVFALAGVACGDDDDGGSASATTEAADETTTTSADDGGDDAETVEITAIDYGYEGVPDSVPAGTRLSLTNDGTEPHEIVAILIPESETRSIGELVQLPEEELGAVFGGEPEPATVILAATGQTDVPGAVVGDGSLTEPGRYGLVCFIPVGSDDSLLEQEGPPADGGEPHAARGMVAEITVE